MNPLLRIVQEMEEDLRELFVEFLEVSIGRLPQNGVKYFEP